MFGIFFCIPFILIDYFITPLRNPSALAYSVILLAMLQAYQNMKLAMLQGAMRIANLDMKSSLTWLAPLPPRENESDKF